MVNRRIYRGVEEAALTGRWEDGDHPHSPLARALRHRYRDLSDSRDIIRCRLLSVSALYSHPGSKLDSGNDFVRDMMSRLAETIQYLPKSGDGAQASIDRMGALYDRMLLEYNRIRHGRDRGTDGEETPGGTAPRTGE